jgi:hypothetical protein
MNLLVADGKFTDDEDGDAEVMRISERMFML